MTHLVKDPLKLETLSLFQQYQVAPNPQLRNRIMELNIGLVRKEAHHWVHQCTEAYEDLVQIGCLGLLRAIERFEVEKGHAFSSFATPYIRGEIQHFLRDKAHCVRIPRRWQEVGQQAINFQKDFQSRCHRQPSEQEIAQGLESPLQEWQEIKQAFQNRQPLSLDLPIGTDEDCHLNLGDCLAHHDYHSFQLSQDDQLRLQQALGQLEDCTRRILEFVFLYDLTQRETAQQMGVSVITVSRRLKKGISLLKQALTTEIF